MLQKILNQVKNFVVCRDLDHQQNAGTMLFINHFKIDLFCCQI